MMTCLYKHLLDPSLYNCGHTAKFVDAIIDPEIISLAEIASEQFCQDMPATDDIISQLEFLGKNAATNIKKQGTISCQFTAFKSPRDAIILESPTPTTKHEIRDLLSGAKCLALSVKAQSIFFTSELYHQKCKPIIGETITNDASWGIQIIGSSARGNSFYAIIDIYNDDLELKTKKPVVKISRERLSTHPFSKFFHISEPKELEDIISKLPKIMHHCNLSERDVIVNFMTIFKSLLKLGYAQ